MKNRKTSVNASQWPLYLMLSAPVMLVLVYSYIPMLGIVIAFQDFYPTSKGYVDSVLNAKFVGLDVYRYVFSLPDTKQVIFNTFFIAGMKIVAKLIFPVIFALLINEVTTKWFKKAVQTITFIPHFFSWVIVAGILLNIFSPRNGAVNIVLRALFNTELYFFGEPMLFPYMLTATDLWKNIGFNTIVILAALTGIDPTLYEAAIVDGAGRIKQTVHITLPGIQSIVLLLAILSLGNVLNAGFDQVYNLYSPAVYSTGDIIDTYVYRTGLRSGQFSVATAVGLFKSAVSTILIILSYWLANKFSDYRVF